MAAKAVDAAATAATATTAVMSFFERCMSMILSRLSSSSGDGVDADDRDAEVTQAVEQAMQLRLVREGAGERGLAGLRGELEVLEEPRKRFAQAAADDDPVAARLCCLVHGPHVRVRLGEPSPPTA